RVPGQLQYRRRRVGMGETHPHAGTPALSTGISPGEHALNIYVVELTSIDTIKSVIVESIGASAASDDSLPLNIIQTGLIQAQPNTARVRPAPADSRWGISRSRLAQLA